MERATSRCSATRARVARKYQPSVVFYSLDPHPLRQLPWGLKLIFNHRHDSYIFRDYADGATFHKTQIPLRKTDPRHVPIRTEDIEQVIHDQINRIPVSPIGAVLSL